MSTSTAQAPGIHVAGSASLWVLAQVAGPRRTATVVHAGLDAVYIDLAGVCLAVLSARAVQVPCGVRTLLPRLPEVAAGVEAFVHDGAIELPGCEVLVTDIVDSTLPVLGSAGSVWAGTHLSNLVGDRLDPTRALLPADALAGLAAADPSSVASLLGLGEGLTPLGDDVLAGWLAAAVSARRPGLAELRSEVALQAHDRTTVLSSTLLACAARGEGVPELRFLIRGIATQDQGVVEESLALLLGIGDTSGQGLMLGAQLALGPATDEAAPR